MLNALQSYQFGTYPLRVIQRDGDSWFAATDVAIALGYRDATAMTRNLDDDEKGTHILCTLGGDQELIIINESGLYAAILRSRRPEARAFRKWVTSEVLPSIRRSGRFQLGDDSARGLATATRLVAEARRLGGKVAAISVWNELGLPPLPEPEPEKPDELLEPLRAILEDKSEVTVEGAILALELPDAETSTRIRVGRLLRQLGFIPKVTRRGQSVIKLFVRELAQ